MGIPIIQVDAFTDRPFAGNPAAICILSEPRDTQWMKSVAAEMNLSETAFLERRADGFQLRWFTPAIEVDLCGHATLASAHALWEGGYLQPGQQARFHTRSGLLAASKSGDWIELDFPTNAPEPTASPPGLLEALGINAIHVEKHRLHYLVEVDSEEVLRGANPNFQALAKVPIRGIIVTCRTASGPYDFLSRYFAPAAGINEDPVTGSAHCCLGPYWQRKLGKDEFLAYQASARGGVVRVRVQGERVLLGGQAVTVLRGELA
ncbi:MAG TPA: PhzF family phenazine biosynthesis protein [Gemmataceae bacterium]|nr:PhzF family phenazine biosynthesis protein [Gemmataceae bacterium]